MLRKHRVFLALLLSSAAHASTINSVSGPLLGTGTVNAFIGTGPNITVSESITAFDPLRGFVLGFDLAATGGSNDYNIIKEVQNQTGFTWTDFTIAVGCDPAAGPPGTVPCPPGPSPMLIDFGAPPSTSSIGSFISNSGPTFVTFSGLNVPTSGIITFRFSLDIAAGVSGIHNMYQYPPGIGAAVPEPSSATLIVMGLLSTGLFRLRGFHLQHPFKSRRNS
jgi:hypothetical protein